MSLSLTNVSGILLDIEGTTTPIAFVHEVLFSYARSQVGNYLAAHFDSAETIADLARLRDEHAVDTKQGLEPPALLDGPRDVEIDSITEYVRWLIERDRKSMDLKSLQGKIWQDGYLDGTLKAQVFADVPRALERWHHAGLKISIFSSGSVLAQRLLFAHTEAGDLTGYIDSYFDTTNGSKTEVESYRRIASGLGLRAEEVLFVSDVVGELDAASAAVMQTLLCLRPGNQVQSFSQQHQIIQSFDEL
jgi:enolase-phosphatase E1